MPPAPADLRRVGHAVADADAPRLRAIVALLDAMPDRGEADRLLDPVRPRLRRLRPVRPLNFTRLLFLPLDPIIVPAANWQRGAPRVPRSVLAPIGAAVQAALAATGAAIGAACAGRPMDDRAVVATLGARLWPAAATALPNAPPADWAQSGLSPADYPPLRNLIGALLGIGEELQDAQSEAAAGPPEALIQAVLVPLLDADDLVFAAVLDALLGLAATPSAVADIALALRPAARPRVLGALDALLEAPPPALDVDDLGSAVNAALARLQRFEALATCNLLSGARTARLQAARHATDLACRALARDAVELTVFAPLRAGIGSDADSLQVEAAARSLRQFTMVAGLIGGAAEHERLVRAAAEALFGPGIELETVDQARLLEILLGPEAAAARLGLT